MGYLFEESRLNRHFAPLKCVFERSESMEAERNQNAARFFLSRYRSLNRIQRVTQLPANEIAPSSCLTRF